VSRLALAALLLALPGCGAEEASSRSGGGGGERPRLTVSAATSLKQAVTRYAEGFAAADVRLSFGGSDELAAQIRQGVEPDVFAAADTKLPAALAAEGLVEPPVVFAGNRLVLAVPAGGDTAIDGLGDLTARGVTLAVGAESVPVGAYTRRVLDRLGARTRDAILANVRSNEPDAGGVVGKLTQGAVDAGFLYLTDVKAAGGRIRAVELPSELQPSVAYGVAVVTGAPQPGAAREFVDGLVRGAGQDALRAAGFEPPPPR